jgi:hypothetical protein
MEIVLVPPGERNHRKLIFKPKKNSAKQLRASSTALPDARLVLRRTGYL